MKQLLERLQRAIEANDYPMPLLLFKENPLYATNVILRSVGAPQIVDMKSRQQVLRAVLALER